MTHPLELKLARLRRRVRRWMLVYGLGRLIAVAVGTVVVLGLIDYLLRFDDRGIRIMLTGGLLAVVAWACHRWLYRPATAQVGTLELAQRLGRRFPELGDDLASAVEFLKQPEDDPVAGSAALRRAVIATTAAKAETIDFTSVVDRRPALGGVLLAVGACLVVGILLVLDTLSCQIAMARLAYPLGEMAWPRKNHLQLVERVDRVARGQPFEVEVIDAAGARLPSRAEIHYRVGGPDGEPLEEVQPMRQVGSTMVARRESVMRPFAYRIEGGDDRRMGWIDVEVVEPPAVASFVATIHPPEYTGLAASQSTGQLRLLRGSRVEIDATATKSLQSATLVLEGGAKVTCRIGKCGRRFTVGQGDRPSFMPERSGFYGFDLVDREGIHGGGDERWEIEVVDDRPPAVSIERPSGTTFVTPEATLPVRVTADDDLALRRIEGNEMGVTGVLPVPTNAQHGQDAGGTRSITLFEGPLRATAAADGTGGQRQTIDTRWNLAALRLRPGQRIVFHASAEDYLPQSGQSDSRAIVVVGREELIDRLAERQEAILAELARALNLQRESRRQLGQLQPGAAGSLGLDQAGVDRLRSAELAEREVNRILTDHDDGVPGQIERLLGELADNRLDSPDVGRRMESLLAELDRLDRVVLPTIAREMTASIKTAEARLEADAAGGGRPSTEQAETSVETSLAAACAGQDEVIAVLARLLGRLSQWNDYRRFHQQWAQLLRRQELLTERTEALGRDLLGWRSEDVAPETATRLTAAGGDQLELGRQLDGLLQEMDSSRVALAQRDPLAAETVADAVARSREQGTSLRMRAAGAAIARNRLGQASSLQAQIIADLRDILDLLANRRRDELARLAEKLPETEGVLSALVRRQRDLRERMEEEVARPAADEDHTRAEWRSLSRQQGQLQTEADALASLLVQLLAERPAESIRAAAAHMAQASQAAGAVEPQSAVSHAKDAEAALDEAARRLAEHLARVEANAAAEELARLEATIRSLHERQQAATDETKRLDAELCGPATRSGARTAALRRLAGDQRAIEADTSELTATLSGAKVFRQVLDEAAGQMAIAAGWLGRQTCDARVQAAQQAALDRLARLVEALRRPPSEAQPSAPGGAQAAAGQQPGKRSAPGAVAQLRLLRMLQEDLFVRTQDWQARFGGQSPLPPEAQEEYKRLSDEQGRLADLLMDLIGGEAAGGRPPQDAPTEQPE